MDDTNYSEIRKFPDDFLFGSSTSSYQVEGAWNVDCKGESIWDHLCHKFPHMVMDGTTGDVAMNSYYQYKDDIAALKQLNAKVYRFSISWPRLFPSGTTETINQAGIDYYNNLINDLLAQDIEPMVTLYHWETPQALEDKGGWLNENLMLTHFATFARLCFSRFGDRVKSWITVNEPFIHSTMTYGDGTMAPVGKMEPAQAPYIVVHNMLKAHATAYEIYNNEFRSTQNGQVGISADTNSYFPKDRECKADLEAVERAYEFRLGWVLDPIFTGNYPQSMQDMIYRKSIEQGMDKSRLPVFSEEWKIKLKGSFDFIGLNYYTGDIVAHKELPVNPPRYDNDHNIDKRPHPNWKKLGAFWQHSVPQGLRESLCWIKNRYNNPKVIITENGASSVSNTLDDEDRVTFFKEHLAAVLDAKEKDGCNVQGYIAWCLLDAFEWAYGHTYCFGLFQVDKDNNFKRTPKSSARYLSHVFETKIV